MRKVFILAALAMGLYLSSCTEKIDAPFYSENAVTNVELRAILEAEGVTFNEAGCIYVDDAAKAITSLDLSGKKIVDLAGLEALSNLAELNLSDNGFGPVFDFSIVPAQVTSIDLTKNDIYEVANLVNIDEQTAKVTLIHDFAKMALPESVKFDCYELPQYSKNDKEVDMKMGEVAYTTLREVPDANTLFLLKQLYPSMFDGDKIDVSRRLVNPKEKTANLEIHKDYLPEPAEGKENEIKSVEGVQYIVLNKGFEGGTVNISATSECELAYLKIGSSVTDLSIARVSTPNLDLSGAENLASIFFTNNHGVTVADLSASKQFGQREYELENGSMKNPSKIQIKYCDNLKSIILPEKARIVNTIQVGELKNLESFDMSKLNAVAILQLVTMPKCKIGYPVYQFDLKPEGYLQWSFGCEKDIFDKPETKAMLDKYHDGLQRDVTMWFGMPAHFRGYDWKSHYNK